MISKEANSQIPKEKTQNSQKFLPSKLQNKEQVNLPRTVVWKISRQKV
jgi:hypothetical protein